MNSSNNNMEQKSGENEADYIKCLRESVEKQCTEIQDLKASNAILAEALAKTNGVPIESLKRDLQEKSQKLELVKSDIAKFESKASTYRDISDQQESVLNSVIDVVNRFGDEEEAPSSDPETEAKAREEAERVVNELSVSLGQEQSKVEKLSERLLELGTDVDELLGGLDDDAGLFEEREQIEDITELLNEGEKNEDNSGLVEERDENEDNAELVEGGEVNKDNAEFVEEGEENEDDAELLEEREEIEDNAKLVEEGEANEDDTGLPEETEEVDNSGSNEDSSVESLIARISNGDQPEDRKNAMDALVNILAYSDDAVIAFGAKGFPVVISVLNEERDDIEMVRSAIEILNNAIQPVKLSELKTEDCQDALINADSFSRESDNISLLLSFLEVDDFLVKDLTLKILSDLVKIFPTRLREAILNNTPRQIAQFMDMITDYSIQNSVLQFLTHFSREAEEIQKIVVSEGAFEKIFGIIKDEGGSDGGYVVEICLKLLNSLLLKNIANQILLQETIGFDPLLSILKLEGASGEQKTCNVFCGLKTIRILIMGGSEEDSSSQTIKATLVQKNVLNILLMLGIESQEAPVEVRSLALKCIGDLISGHPENCDALARIVLGEDSQEPALNSILRTIFGTSSTQEFVAADYIFKSFCEKNPEGQSMLASTLTEQKSDKSFGSLLLQGFALTEREGDLETCGRAASVLSHVLKDNNQSKQAVLGLKLEASATGSASEPLMGNAVKRLAIASLVESKGESKESVNSYSQPALLKLLVVWLSDCPVAVKCFLDSHPNLTLLLGLLSNESVSAHSKGLAALVLGQCVIYNEAIEGNKDAFTVFRAINRKVELMSYFQNLDEIQNEDNPVLSSIFDTLFVTRAKSLESDIREKVVEFQIHPKKNGASVPPELEQRSEESDADYIERLKEFHEKQCAEMKDLLASNAIMTRDLAKTGGVPIETLIRDLHRATQQIKLIKSEKAKALAEALMYLEISDQLESELNRVNSTFQGVKFEIARSALPNIGTIKAKVRANSLSVWLGHEQSKVEKLSTKLVELGENVDKLLEGIEILRN